MNKHDSDIGEGLEKKTHDIEPEELPVFDPAEPIVCPKCKVRIEGDEEIEWQINHDGIWYFTCQDCGTEWQAVMI